MRERDRFDELKGHVDVVFESLRGDIRVLAEGHASVTSGIEGLRAGQEVLERRVEQLSAGQDSLRSEQGTLRAGQDALRLDVKGLRQETTELRLEVRHGFGSVRSAIRRSHGRLDERVSRVERDVAVLKMRARALGPRKGRS